MNTPEWGADAPGKLPQASFATIGLLITNLADRGLLLDFLQQSGYRVRADEPFPVSLEDWAEISMVIADEYAARQFEPELLALKAQGGGSFLPILVALAKNSASPPWLKAGFDDVLRMPIKKAELAARVRTFLTLREQSREQYREIFENAPVGIYRAMPDGRILIMNPALLQMLGYATFEEFSSGALGKETAAFFAPPHFQTVLERASDGNGVEITMPKGDNTPIDVRTKARAMRGGDGTVLYYEGTIDNITAQKHAAQALFDSQERFRTVWEIAADAMALSDANGIVLAANTAYYRLYGYPSKQIIGKEFSAIFPASRRAEMIKQYKQVFEKSEAFAIFESVILRADGVERTVETHIDFIIQDGQRTAMVSSIRDITQRKLADAELYQAKSELEERVVERTMALASANAELRRLTQQVVLAQETERQRLSRQLHDEIGQALTAVSFNLQAYQQVSDPTIVPHLQESLSIIENTLQQVRDLSLDLHPSILDDLGLVEALRWYLGRQAERAGFTGTLVAEPAEMNLPTDLKTTCFRIAQEALTNILRHAHAKHVWIELRETETMLELLIRDDGDGFAAMSGQLSAGRRASLGLLGMQERALLLKGLLQVKSAPGKGAEIRVRFPLNAAPLRLFRGRRKEREV